MDRGLIAPIRSWLFAPGSNARIMAKALDSHAHAVILDLEDAVALNEKGNARSLVATALRQSTSKNLHVRINALSTDFAFDDVAAAVAPGLTGIVLPKTESARDVEILDWLILQHERSADMPEGTIAIVPLLETAAGVGNALAIARASTRIRQMAFGAGDFTLELNIRWSRGEAELLPARSAIVLASRHAEIQPPIDAVWVEMGDCDGMALSAGRARDHGFQGKLCIHPDQVGAVHHAFTPSEQELACARRIVSAFEEAVGQGKAAVEVDGKMIDYPIVAIALRTLADAESH